MYVGAQSVDIDEILRPSSVKQTMKIPLSQIIEFRERQGKDKWFPNHIDAAACAIIRDINRELIKSREPVIVYKSLTNHAGSCW